MTAMPVHDLLSSDSSLLHDVAESASRADARAASPAQADRVETEAAVPPPSHRSLSAWGGTSPAACTRPPSRTCAMPLGRVGSDLGRGRLFLEGRCLRWRCALPCCVFVLSLCAIQTGVCARVFLIRCERTQQETIELRSANTHAVLMPRLPSRASRRPSYTHASPTARAIPTHVNLSVRVIGVCAHHGGQVRNTICTATYR
mmetsp:Transcript_30533/g.65607  ORF Transcript_30533/g.65607 Transcript_30533/m.65607 type:complete len:202 (+) Transcript_30533:549-1154(+)